jgi:hypothetical protein
MARGSSSFLKRQKEIARQQWQQDKAERKKQRKLEKSLGISDGEPAAESEAPDSEAQGPQQPEPGDTQ